MRSQYVVGVTLLLASAVTFSSAGIFTKAVTAGAWEVIFWRGVFAGLLTTAWIAKRGTLRREFLEMGQSGIAVAILMALGTAAFIPAFKFTSIANVSLIYAVVPLIAAVMAWGLVNEPLTRRVLLGSLGALAGVLVIVSGSIGALHLRGDLLAMFMTVCMAGVIVIYRMYPDTPGAGPSALQSLILIVPSLIFGAPFETAPPEIAILAGFGLLFAIASVTLAEGAKRVPAGQTALLSALETPLAPVLAFLILTEVPNQASFIGGAIVLVAVLASIREETTG